MKRLIQLCIYFNRLSTASDSSASSASDFEDSSTSDFEEDDDNVPIGKVKKLVESPIK